MADSTATHRKDDNNSNNVGGNQKFRRNTGPTRGGGNATNTESSSRGRRNFNGPSNRSKANYNNRGRGRGAPQLSSEAPVSAVSRQLGATRTPEPEGASAPVSTWFPLPKTEAEEQEMLERAMAESHQEAKRNGFGVEDPEVSNGTSQFAYQTSPSADTPVPNRTLQPTAPCESPAGLSAEDFVTLGARPKLANRVPAPAVKTLPPAEPKQKIKEPPTFKTDQVVQQFQSNENIDHSLRDTNFNTDDSNQWRFPKPTEVPQQQPVSFPVTVPVTQPGNINQTVIKPEIVPVPPFSVDVVAEPARTPWPESESTAPAWLRDILQGFKDQIDALQEQLSLCPTRDEICNMSQMPPPWAMHLMHNVDSLNQNLNNRQQIMTTMNDSPTVSDLSVNAREFVPVPTYEVPCQSYDSTQMPVEQQPEMVQFYFAQGTQPIYQLPRSGVLNANWLMPRTNGRGHRPFAKQSRVYRNARGPM